MVDSLKNNARHLQTDMKWLSEVIKQRWLIHNEMNKTEMNIENMTAPLLSGEGSFYNDILKNFKISVPERIVLLLSLVPHIAPYCIDDVMVSLNGKLNSSVYVPGKNGTVPTIDLALFVLAGDDLEKRFRYQKIFDNDSNLISKGILLFENDESAPSRLQQPIKISNDYLSWLTSSKDYKPDFSMNFPAKRIETGLEWKDLVLNENTMEQVNEIKLWINYSKTLLDDWELGKRLAPGYKVLFFGPPGTGKTFTASLLGKATGLDVYKIDLSMVVSKYIGETEKNLSKIFDAANNKKWILFFDEADALFGKRTEVKDAHDRYANQEVAYLLQKVEIHNGVVILSSNQRSNIDDAFNRRFQNIIYFPFPTSPERLKIWEQAFSKKSKLDKDVNLLFISEKYNISGGAIMNVVRYASLKALEEKTNIIRNKNIINGIMREFSKEGRTV